MDNVKESFHRVDIFYLCQAEEETVDDLLLHYKVTSSM